MGKNIQKSKYKSLLLNNMLKSAIINEYNNLFSLSIGQRRVFYAATK